MKLLLILLVTLIGCSKSPTTKLELSTSYLVSGASGGLVLQLKNLKTLKKESMILTDNTISLQLDGENWEFVAYGWDAAFELGGNLMCARKTVVLTPPSMKVELNPTIAGCDDDYFSPAAYRVSNVTRDLRIIDCKTISGASAGSNCDSTSKGYGYSYKVKVRSTKGNELTSICYGGPADPMSTTTTATKIPFGSADFGPETIILPFEDASCTSPMEAIRFPAGLVNGATGRGVTYPFAAFADVFIATTYLSVPPLNLTTVVFGNPSSISFPISNFTGANITNFSLVLPPGVTYVGGTFPGIGGDCGTTLANGANCQIGVEVNPTVAGAFTASIIINYNNGTAGSRTTTISGFFETPANLNFGAGSHSFGNVLVNTKKVQNFTVTNTGQTNASGLSYSFTGADASDFSHTTTCGTTLLSGTSCTVDVITAPGKEGSLSANFLVTYGNGVTSVSSTLPLTATANDLYVTNGPVETLLVSGSTLYVGGSFKNLARRSGGGMKMRTGSCNATGCLHTNYANLSAVPKVAGTVKASVSDGTGGFYIGGDFTHVGSFPRTNLAHILSDGTVDPLFTIATDSTGAVYSLAISGTTLYVAGQFTTLDGQSRPKLGAIDTTTRNVLSFTPSPNNFVYTLTVSGTTLYVGGAFTTIGGQPRNRLAAFDTTTNAVTSWDPNVAGSQVQALSVNGPNLYIGGSFTTVGGQSRANLARVDTATAAVDPWNPTADNIVLSLANDGTNLYVGGLFSNLNSTPRGKLGSYNMSSQALNPFDGNMNGHVYSLHMDTSAQTLYVGGNFTQSGATTRFSGAAFSTTTHTLTGFNPDLNDTIQTISQSGTSLFIGGMFTGISVVTRSLLAAIDLNTGAPTSFNPTITGTAVYTLLESAGTLFFGGQFTNVNGNGRGHIAAVDSSTGVIRSFNPVADNDVYSLALDGSTIIAGGAFYNIGGESRTHLAVLDSTTGSATAFNAVLNPGYVKSVTTDGTDIYFGGSFTNVNGQTRNNIASVDKTTASNTSFDPNSSHIVKEIILDGPATYAIGQFASIGGQSRNWFAALDSVAGTAGALNPNPANAVNDMFLAGSYLFFAGNFTTISGQSRAGLAMIDTSVGNPTALSVTPPPSYTGKAVTYANGIVFFGGQFKAMNGQARGNLFLSGTP